MTIKEFILAALQYESMSESTAQKILKRILLRLGYDPRGELPERK